MTLATVVRRILLTVTLGASASCSDATAPVLPIEGEWAGETDRYSLTFVLAHDDGVLEGYGTVIDHDPPPESTDNWHSYEDIVGTYARPIVHLNFSGGPHPALTFEGRVDRSSMTGTLMDKETGLVDEFTLKRVCRYMPPSGVCP